MRMIQNLGRGWGEEADREGFPESPRVGLTQKERAHLLTQQPWRSVPLPVRPELTANENEMTHTHRGVCSRENGEEEMTVVTSAMLLLSQALDGALRKHKLV